MQASSGAHVCTCWQPTCICRRVKHSKNERSTDRPAGNSRPPKRRVVVVGSPAEASTSVGAAKPKKLTPKLKTKSKETPPAADKFPPAADKFGVTVARGASCAPVDSIQSLQGSVSTHLLGVLAGLYHKATPVQAQTWPLALGGSDVIVVAQTGSGKTVAYLLPVIDHLVRAAAPPVSSRTRPSLSPQALPQKPGMPTAPQGLPQIPGMPAGCWKCIDCGNVNYPLRENCNTRTCKALRPAPTCTSPPRAPALPAATAKGGTGDEVQVDAGEHGLTAQPTALVLAPTRELALQITKEASRLSAGLGVRIACIYGGVGKGAQAARVREGGGVQLLIATPGRCLDFLANSSLIGTPLSLDYVTCLVLDEADRMLEVGVSKDIMKIAGRCALRQGVHTEKLARFVDMIIQRDASLASVSNILANLRTQTHPWTECVNAGDVFKVLQDCKGVVGKETPQRRQTLLISATWPAGHVQDAAKLIVAGEVVEVRVAADSERADAGSPRCASATGVEQQVEVLIHHADKFAALTSALAQHGSFGGCLLFAKTKSRCDWLVKKLLRLDSTALAHASTRVCPQNRPVSPQESTVPPHKSVVSPQKSPACWIRALHSGLSQAVREETLLAFRRAVAAQQGALLVVTNVAARGLDVEALARVLVYDFGGVTNYTHQIGRTGRAGLAGKATCFYVDGDGEATALVQLLQRAGQAVPLQLLAIAKKE